MPTNYVNRTIESRLYLAYDRVRSRLFHGQKNLDAKRPTSLSDLSNGLQPALAGGPVYRPPIEKRDPSLMFMSPHKGAISSEVKESVHGEIRTKSAKTSEKKDTIDRYLDIKPAPGKGFWGKVGRFCGRSLKIGMITGELLAIANFPYIGAFFVPFASSAAATLITGGVFGLFFAGHLTYLAARTLAFRRVVKKLYRNDASKPLFLQKLSNLMAEGKDISRVIRLFKKEERQAISSSLDEIMGIGKLDSQLEAPETPENDTEKNLLPPDPESSLPTNIQAIALKKYQVRSIESYKQAINDFLALNYFINHNTSLSSDDFSTLELKRSELLDIIKREFKSDLPIYQAINTDREIKEYLLLPAMDNHEKAKKPGLMAKAHLVGSGGMAEVYLVMDLKDGRIYTAKFNKFLGNEDICRRFENESRFIMEKGKGKAGVVQVVARASNFFVMEYMDPAQGWMTLDQYIIPLDRAEEVILEIATKIAGILADITVKHRDLKLENIFINQNGEIKIGDWGLAQLEGIGEKGTATHIVAGTHPLLAPAYVAGYGRIPKGELSPEQTAQKDKLNSLEDMYALGGIIYKLLTRFYPTWKGENNRSFRICGEPKNSNEIKLETALVDYHLLIKAKVAGNAAEVQRIKDKYTLLQQGSSPTFIVSLPIYDVLRKIVVLDESDNEFLSKSNPMLTLKHALDSALDAVKRSNTGIEIDLDSAPSSDPSLETPPEATAAGTPKSIAAGAPPPITPGHTFLSGKIEDRRNDLMKILQKEGQDLPIDIVEALRRLNDFKSLSPEDADEIELAIYYIDRRKSDET